MLSVGQVLVRYGMIVVVVKCYDVPPNLYESKVLYSNRGDRPFNLPYFFGYTAQTNWVVTNHTIALDSEGEVSLNQDLSFLPLLKQVADKQITT